VARDSLGLLGHVIDGQIRLDQLVGEGGFAVVYRGILLASGESIAVKCLKLQAATGTEEADAFARRFRDEGRLLQGLSQGNADIVRCISMSTTISPVNGNLFPYMALEWLDGNTLGVDLRRRREAGMRGRSLAEVIALFEPAALALDWAHRHGVVHRDVKPGNLFLTPTASGRVRMKVLDFGLAKILDERMDITMAATSGNVLMCSPRYAAPEHFDLKLGGYGPWTDVYSFALVLLEALADRRVRKADGLLPCMEAALDSNTDMRARTLGIDVPETVEQVLARAVALKPKARQATAGQLWAELTAAAASFDAPPSFVPDTARTPSATPPISAPPEGPRSLGGTLIMNRPSPVARPVPSAPAPAPVAPAPASAPQRRRQRHLSGLGCPPRRRGLHSVPCHPPPGRRRRRSCRRCPRPRWDRGARGQRGSSCFSSPSSPSWR
jgi:eukaryotic-like serine/threonine-protein kinase